MHIAEPEMARFMIDCAFVLALMLLGAWLEGIGGKYGVFDELLTPVPLGLGGLLMEIMWT